jgi:hypothetical protein
MTRPGAVITGIFAMPAATRPPRSAHIRPRGLQRVRSGLDMAGLRGNWLRGNPEVQIRALCAPADDLRAAIAGPYRGVFAAAELVCIRRAIGWAWHGLGGNVGISRAVA